MKEVKENYCNEELLSCLKNINYPVENQVLWSPFGDKKFYSKIHIYDVQKWFRDVHRMEVNAFFEPGPDVWRGYIIHMDFPELSGSFPMDGAFDSYESALSDALRNAATDYYLNLN